MVLTLHIIDFKTLLILKSIELLIKKEKNVNKVLMSSSDRAKKYKNIKLLKKYFTLLLNYAIMIVVS